MSTDLDGWIATLDELEAGIAEAEAQLDAGDAAEIEPVAPWQAPEGIGPLPASLQQRATSLSWRMTAVEQRLRDRRGVLRSQLDDLSRRRTAGAAYAAAGPGVTHTGREISTEALD